MAKKRATKQSSRRATLVIASSDVDSNLYWSTHFLAGDPFIYIEHNGRKTILTGELELGRARKEARVDEVVSVVPFETALRTARVRPRPAEVIRLYLRGTGVRTLEVPANFPLGHAERLRAKGYRVKPREDPFCPGRLKKSAQEIESIAHAQEATEAAMEHAIGIIAASRIDGKVLRRKGEILTSESVRAAIRAFLLDRGYLATEIIVAGGDDACDPHVRGAGPLPANTPIVIDIFPRSLETRFWGDMTRTVVRGRASDGARKLYRDVSDAVDLVLSLLRPGVEGAEIHQAVVDHFAARGNETGEDANGRMCGFFHGTGHGVGLDLHESPRIGKTRSTLSEGSVVTVEPGLYYPGVGAVRIEDLVVVETRGVRNLNRLPRVFEI